MTAPFLGPPYRKHFHFGVGPYFNIDVLSKTSSGSGPSTDYNKDTSVGIKGEITGWL